MSCYVFVQFDRAGVDRLVSANLCQSVGTSRPVRWLRVSIWIFPTPSPILPPLLFLPDTQFHIHCLVRSPPLLRWRQGAVKVIVSQSFECVNWTGICRAVPLTSVVKTTTTTGRFSCATGKLKPVQETKTTTIWAPKFTSWVQQRP